MQKISQCLNHQLITICQKAVQIEELTHKIKQYLPSTLRDHCCVSSFNQGCLVIATTDATATELRYALPALRDQLRQEAQLYSIVSIKITLLKQYSIENKLAKKPPNLSDAARQAIIATSDLCVYQPLKQALYQLARPACDLK